MKKVLLVNTNMARAPYPAPPIGISLVAAGLEGKYEARVYDGTFAGGGGLPAVLEEFKPDYVGVGIRNIDDFVTRQGGSFIESIHDEFIRPLKDACSVPLILGGAGFSLFPARLMELFKADYGIVGEADTVFPALLRALDAGEDTAIPGVVARTDEGVISAERVSPAEGRLNIRFSNIDRKVDYGPYRGRGSYPVQTKRGCVHRCIYCTYPFVEGNRYRVRPPSDVVDEIEEASRRLGAVTFEFVDSTFNDPPGHAEEICREIARRKLDVRLRTMGVNPANVTAPLLDLMKQAGFAQIDCTPDCASPGMIARMRKNFSRETLEKAAGHIRDQGMPTMWFFIFGGPGETRETFLESLDFIDRFIVPEDMVHMTEGLRVYPGTGLFDTALAQGIVQESDNLIEPFYYVSPGLGAGTLARLVRRAAADRLNCVPSSESAPGPAMMKEAVRIREAEGLTEPMFRTLLRLRRKAMR
ncbi:MAG: radical SAM protein [Pseudomonadota bacterium]